MKKSFIFIILLSLVIGCQKNEPDVDICEDLQSAILNDEDAFVSNVIDAWSIDLTPQPTVNDLLGHQENLNTLVERIEQNCEGFSVSVVCYACIETLPLQSKIRIIVPVEVTSGSAIAIRIIDIKTPANDILSFAGMQLW